MKRAFALAMLLVACARTAPAQKCPPGPVDIPALTAQIYEAKDPTGANVVLRAAAIGDQPLIPALRQLSKPDKELSSVAGAAQTALAKLGDEHAFSEIVDELNANPPHVFHDPERAIYKLLYIANDKAIAALLDFLAAHEAQPIIAGYEVDAPYDVRSILLEGLGDIVENAPLQGNGDYKGTMDDWVTWWQRDHAKPAPLSIGLDFSNPHSQCLERKFDWGFPMALIDLAATGDQRLIPAIKRIAATGYPYQGYAGTRAPYIWLRHDYVEVALAKFGDEKSLEISLRHPSPYADQAGLVKFEIVSGQRSMNALIESISQVDPRYAANTKPLMAALSRMVQNPPLPPDAPATMENLHKWQSWWAENRSTAKFTPYTKFE